MVSFRKINVRWTMVQLTNSSKFLLSKKTKVMVRSRTMNERIEKGASPSLVMNIMYKSFLIEKVLDFTLQ